MSREEAKKFYISGTKTQALYFCNINYALIKWGNEFVCCWNPEINNDLDGLYISSWSQGHYFNNFEEAKDYLSDKFVKELDDYFNYIGIINEEASILLETKETEVF